MREMNRNGNATVTSTCQITSPWGAKMFLTGSRRSQASPATFVRLLPSVIILLATFARHACPKPEFRIDLLSQN